MQVQGEQVFISYGAQSNDSLLQFYGFVEPGNPNDSYTVPDLREALLMAGCASVAASIESLPHGQKVSRSHLGLCSLQDKHISHSRLEAFNTALVLTF